MFDFLGNLTPPQNLTGPMLITYTLIDIFLIVVLARILGNLMTKISQPRVVGEILAGVILGPTLLGNNLSFVIAPGEVRPVLSTFATMALALFMFLAGVEFDQERVKGRVGQAGVLAFLAITIPALLGFPVAQLMATSDYMGPAASSVLPFALFIGAALAVTAFPVMAHILMERGELNTKMGSLGVATTGIMSVLMFSYIALAVAVATAGDLNDFLVKIGLILLFGLISWFAVRPLLQRLMSGDEVTGNGMAVCFAGLALYAAIGHQLGINAIVGGFLWGLILPVSPSLRASISGKVKDISMIFFLPIFFAMAGFQTDLKLLTPATIPAVILMLSAAILGKFLAALPAKAYGMNWLETGILAALFNTRGLLVLVAGLIGLQFEMITTLTFTIIVVVALVTNLMTVPLLNLFSARQKMALEGAKIQDAVK
ncbi:MAG TPA: cation:proton antiporter [Anaerolineales bacterium]|nr:cation:proton antiporter [Anaerolineales bacterium]